MVVATIVLNVWVYANVITTWIFFFICQIRFTITIATETRDNIFLLQFPEKRNFIDLVCEWADSLWYGRKNCIRTNDLSNCGTLSEEQIKLSLLI